jgi:hypothetical protein
MALVRRYAADEETFFKTMIFPEEDRAMYTRERWSRGFRWYRAPNVVCLEHYKPFPPVPRSCQPIEPDAVVR